MTKNKKSLLNNLQASMDAIVNGEPSAAFAPVFEEKKVARKSERESLFEPLSDLLEERASIKEEDDHKELIKKMKRYALDCLIRREHGTQELLRKMLKKEFDQNLSENILEEITHGCSCRL